MWHVSLFCSLFKQLVVWYPKVINSLRMLSFLGFKKITDFYRINFIESFRFGSIQKFLRGFTNLHTRLNIFTVFQKNQFHNGQNMFQSNGQLRLTCSGAGNLPLLVRYFMKLRYPIQQRWILRFAVQCNVHLSRKELMVA